MHYHASAAADEENTMLRSPMRVLALIAIVTLMPNLLWLSRSSVSLLNATPTTVTLRLILADDPEQVVEAGTLAPGEGRFLFIAPSGEATLSVEVQEGLGWLRHCSEYVEAGMYRVEVTIRTPEDVTCATSLPLFERLLIRDVLS
jgi:hypothetical protein